MGLKGVDTFFPAPSTKKTMRCLACGSECVVKRNVYGATGFAEGVSGGGHLHDLFSCPHVDKEWHDKAVDLHEAIEEMPSESVAALMKKDLAKLVKSNVG